MNYLFLFLILAAVAVYAGLLAVHPGIRPDKRKIRVACVGDSITYGSLVKDQPRHNYPHVLNELLGEDYQVGNFGYPSRTAVLDGDHPYMKEKLYEKSLSFEPDIVIIMFGSNDSKLINWDAEEYERDLCLLIDSYKDLKSHPRICLLIPPPCYRREPEFINVVRNEIIVEEIAPLLIDIASLKDLDLIDMYQVFEGKKEFFADGLHPNQEGAVLFAKTVYEHLLNDHII